jgi:hypothetical protein
MLMGDLMFLFDGVRCGRQKKTALEQKVIQRFSVVA